MKKDFGISLISLIITIIVIIILAAIVIFSGMGTPEKAQLSAVVSDIDNVQTAVDQAYYGLYAEKSVAGEVWTKSQFYEAVATGETNRDNLSGTGIVPISEEGMIKMTLPKYEGRSWGVAVEDIDDTTKVGSVVLIPGYETDGKIYATLLDVQNDGRDATSMELAMGKVKNENFDDVDCVKLSYEDGCVVVKVKFDDEIIKKAELDNCNNSSDFLEEFGYVNTFEELCEKIEIESNEFLTMCREHYVEDTLNSITNTQRISVSTNDAGETIFYGLPIELGEVKITDSITGKTKSINITGKLQELSDIVKVGDYVEYIPDNDTYTTEKNNTGYTLTQTITTETRDWRVLYVDKETGEVLLTTNGAVNLNIHFKGKKGYFGGIAELNNICEALYSNSTLGITARSMSIEDLNKACNYTPSTMPARYAYYKGGTKFEEDDKTIEYKGNVYRKSAPLWQTLKIYASDGGGIEKTDSNGFKYREPQDNNPVYVTDSSESYSQNLQNSKVGEILGNNFGWIASQVNCTDYGATTIGMWAVKNDTFMLANLYNSKDYNEYDNYFSIRPVVSLNSSYKLKYTTETTDGKSSNTAWKITTK